MKRYLLQCECALATAMTALVLCALALTATAAETQAQWDGLMRIPSKQFDLVYVRPGASLAGYKRVQLDAVEVAFAKDWDPNRDVRELSRRLSQSDIEALKADLVAEFGKAFKEELGKAGYALVEQSGEGVLRVTARVKDLYINAPDAQGVNRVRSFVADAGHMTLVAELRDAITGQALAHIVDREQGLQIGRVQTSTSVTNSAEVQRIVAAWADALRKEVIEADAKPAGK